MGERKYTVSDTTAAERPGAADSGAVNVVLREARERLGIELRDAASMLRIRYVYLQAIEDGRYDALPGAAYAIGFLRSYAEFLGLDGEQMLRRYKEEAAGRLRKPEPYYLPTPATGGGVPGGTMLLGTLVLAGVVYGSWYYLSTVNRSVTDMVPVLPDRLVSLLDHLPWNSSSAPPTPAAEPVEPAPAPVSPADAPAPAAPVVQSEASAMPATPASPPVATPPPAPTPAVSSTAPAASASGVPIPSRSPLAHPSSAAPAAASTGQPATAPADEDEADTTAQAPTPLVTPPPAAVVPPPPPVTTVASSGKFYGSQNTNARFQIRAKQDSWIQIRDSSDIIFTRVLKTGDTYRVPDRSGLRLHTGNAGGLVLFTDGVEGAPMGSDGQVLRGAPLDGTTKPGR